MAQLGISPNPFALRDFHGDGEHPPVPQGPGGARVAGVPNACLTSHEDWGVLYDSGACDDDLPGVVAVKSHSHVVLLPDAFDALWRARSHDSNQ